MEIDRFIERLSAAELDQLLSEVRRAIRARRRR